MTLKNLFKNALKLDVNFTFDEYFHTIEIALDTQGKTAEQRHDLVNDLLALERKAKKWIDNSNIDIYNDTAIYKIVLNQKAQAKIEKLGR